MFHHFPHPADTPVIVWRKANGSTVLCGLQQVQRQIAPEGQAITGQIVHPRSPQKHCLRAERKDPLLGLQLVLTIGIGGGERQRFGQGAGLGHTCVYLIRAE